MGTHVHTHSGKLHPAGKCTDVNNINLSENKEANKNTPPKKHQPTTTSKQKKQTRHLICRYNHVSCEYCVWSCIVSFKSSLPILDWLFPYEHKLKDYFSIVNVKIQLKYLLQKLKPGVNRAWINVPLVTLAMTLIQCSD